MENKIQYEKLKFTDWSKHQFLTTEQRNKLIQEKIERAKIQYLTNQRCPTRTTS